VEKEKIIFFDTTLRDGEQTMGVNLDAEEKLEIASALSKMGVDVIEAGFPIAAERDFASVKYVAENLKQAQLAALVRTSQRDIDVARDALKKAESPRLNVFMGISDVLLEHKYQMTRNQAMAHAQEAVRYARQFFGDVQFSAEDSLRSDWDFVCQLFQMVIAAGATTVTLCDTVGYAMPSEMANLTEYVKSHVENIDKAVIGVHCHNDLAQAAANSLSSVKCGARQIECTVNGLGERAGNAPLEAVVMALKTRRDYYGVNIDIDTRQLYRASRMVSSFSGLAVPVTQPIVGDNVFRHSNVMHQMSVANCHSTYEIMEPESIGIKRNLEVLRPSCGEDKFAQRLVELGYNFNAASIERLYGKFKELAKKKSYIFDRDIEAMINSKDNNVIEYYKLLNHSVLSGDNAMSMAAVKLVDNKGEVMAESSIGDGPVDAVFKAIQRAAGYELTLKDYQVKAVTSGQDALGEASVWIDIDDHEFSGRGLSTDIIEASALAYLNALNKYVSGSREK
jgi:2-isopropylmalate synthase